MTDAKPIVERLLATKQIVVDFDMIEARATTEGRLVNPDGPEAAAAISELVEALTQIACGSVDMSPPFRAPPREEMQRIAHNALTRMKAGEA